MDKSEDADFVVPEGDNEVPTAAELTYLSFAVDADENVGILMV